MGNTNMAEVFFRQFYNLRLISIKYDSKEKSATFTFEKNKTLSFHLDDDYDGSLYWSAFESLTQEI